MQEGQSRVQWVYSSTSNEELQDRYDQWAAEYDRDLTERFEWRSPQIAGELLAKYVSTGAKVLDAGAGTGLVGEVLAGLGYRDLSAMDLSPGMLEEARRKGVYRELRQMTLGEELAYGTDAFDAVLSIGVFTTGHAPARGLDELVRITKPGGYVIFSLRPDLYEEGGFKEHQAGLEASGRWELAELTDPFRSLPKGEPDIVHRIWVYRVTA